MRPLWRAWMSCTGLHVFTDGYPVALPRVSDPVRWHTQAISPAVTSLRDLAATEVDCLYLFGRWSVLPCSDLADASWGDQQQHDDDQLIA